MTGADIRAAIRGLHLSDLPLMIHASLRSFGTIAGGADSLVDALLSEGCAILVPAFSAHFLIAPPRDMRPERNDWDYSVNWATPRSTKRVFTPRTNIVDVDLGVLPRTVLQRRERRRGNHPLNSFAALGPRAGDLVAAQSPTDVYAPIRRLAAESGHVVLMGVGLDRMTALHEAESLAGRTLFQRWALDPNGQPMMASIGSCSDGFPRLDSALAPIERQVTVGGSLWRVFPAQATIELAAATIRASPEITRCDKPGCTRCRDAIAGGPVLQTR